MRCHSYLLKGTGMILGLAQRFRVCTCLMAVMAVAKGNRSPGSTEDENGSVFALNPGVLILLKTFTKYLSILLSVCLFFFLVLKG